jgi:hypothetical protein
MSRHNVTGKSIRIVSVYELCGVNGCCDGIEHDCGSGYNGKLMMMVTLMTTTMIPPSTRQQPQDYSICLAIF